MSKIISIVASAILGMVPSPDVQGRIISCGPNPERVEVAYGKPTIFRFEAATKTVSNSEKFEIAPANTDVPDYTTLVVEPRTTASSDTVVFILSDGSVAKLLLVPLSGQLAENLDKFHEVKIRSEVMAKKEEPDLANQLPDGEESEGKVELMKALILGTQIRGYQVRELTKPIQTGLSGVDAALTRVYAGSDYNGYVFKLTNKSATQSYEIDIRRLKIGEPNLALMSQVDRKLIEPQATGRQVAFLTIVAFPSSLSRDVVLPVTWVKREDRQK